jgi:hypothetical protein
MMNVNRLWVVTLISCCGEVEKEADRIFLMTELPWPPLFTILQLAKDIGFAFFIYLVFFIDGGF